MKRTLIIVVILASFTFGCNRNKRTYTQIVELDTLITGEFKMDDSIFGETIELEGTAISSSAIFNPKFTHLIANDSILVLRLDGYVGNTHAFYIFRLPDFTPIGRVGSFGRGPFEFNSPHSVKTIDPSAILYVYELMTGKMYKLNNKYSLEEIPSPFTPRMRGAMDDNGIINIAENEYLYVNTTSTETHITRTEYDKTNDQYIKTNLLDLRFKPEISVYVAFSGNFSVNPSKNRMAYAYTYYRRVLFSDINGENTRVLTFPGSEYDEGTAKIADGMYLNNMYYYNAIAGDKYLYLMYNGRDLQNVQGGIIHNMYLEQWDWNGNPLRRYKLDQYGYVTIDEKKGKIYLVSGVSEIPFFVYDLPEL